MLIRKENDSFVVAFTVESSENLTYLHEGLHDLLTAVGSLPTPEAQHRAHRLLALLLEAAEAPAALMPTKP